MDRRTEDLRVPTLTPTHFFLLLWVTLASIFVLSHIDFFFAHEHTELGDFASNALQIERAKSFREIYGNYSRFGFHHPGPGFFYVYSLGERVFYGLLHAVPCEFNAQLITSILLQSGFFVWGLAILTRYVRHPLFLPLALLAAAAHFGAVNHYLRDSTFESIWPPQVLLFPFFCFLCACASLACGRVRDPLPATIAGCFLVHGHVTAAYSSSRWRLLSILPRARFGSRAKNRTPVHMP